MTMTVDQRIRMTLGELFIQNVALQVENEQLKAQLAEKADAAAQEPAAE